ncbi:MAG: hypothetical protein ACXVKQ_01835 [Acidimicrobiia bacterium]
METLKKVSRYHQAGSHKHHGVYHDRADCPTGQLIHSEDLKAGGRGLRYCEQCAALNGQAPEPD